MISDSFVTEDAEIVTEATWDTIEQPIISSKKQILLDSFSDFIANLPEDMFDEKTLQDAQHAPDLYQLYETFIGLKAEIKQESRQFKTALDTFKSVFETLQKSHDTVNQELQLRRQEYHEQIEAQSSIVLKPMLLEIIGLYDRMLLAVTNYQSISFSCFDQWNKKLCERIRSMQTGEEMLLNRVEQLLSQYDVHPYDVLHLPFDPENMQACGITQNADLDADTVSVEVEKGFLWKEKILRIAKVQVNKL